MKKSVAVLGLGIFGSRLVDELVDLGADVLIADADKEQVNHYSDKVSYAMSADLSSPEAIKGIGIENMDAVIVSMASCLESSIM
nr:NAD-binding protein [Lachnospiraceae bacterium]MCR5390762.1 NAD-binding protein [Lachnospiraceae bacterium]